MTYVSDHPLTHTVVKRAQAVHTFVGAFLMLLADIAVWRILTGNDNLAGGLTVQSITYEWVLFVPFAAFIVYKHQAWVSLQRPTGKGPGFWYGLVDFVPSLAMAIITGGAWASWLSPLVGRTLGRWGLPTAPYTKETTYVAAIFLVASILDVFYYHWRRAKYGRAEIINAQVASVLPDDQVAIIVRRADIPHGFGLFRRKSTGGVDYTTEGLVEPVVPVSLRS